MKKGLLLSVIVLFILTGSALAYRPFTTEDSGVAGKGVLQTEVSYDYFQWKNGDTDQIYLLVSPIYGPTESLELSVETPYVIHSVKGGTSYRGIGDINLVAKQVLIWDDYEKKDALLTAKGLVKLDTGSFEKGLGRGDVEYSLFPVVSKSIGEYLTVHGQLGYTFVTHKKDPDLANYFFYGAALDWAFTKPLHFVIEYNGNKNPESTQVHQRMALGGFTYEVSKHLTIDASFKKGLSDSSPNWGVGIGAAIEF